MPLNITQSLLSCWRRYSTYKKNQWLTWTVFWPLPYPYSFKEMSQKWGGLMRCSELLSFFDTFPQPLYNKEVSDVTWQYVISVKPLLINWVASWTMLHRSWSMLACSFAWPDVCPFVWLSMSMCVCTHAYLHVSSLHSNFRSHRSYTMNASTVVVYDS